MHDANATADVHTAPTVRPGPTLEQQLRDSLRAQYEAMSTAQLEAESHRLAARRADNGCLVDGPCDCYRCEEAAEVFALHERGQGPVPREPSMLPPAAKREHVAIGALVFHQGPCCSECDGTGLIDTGWDNAGRAVMERCACAIESCGEVYSRGQVCDGPDADGCSIGIYPERLVNGGFQLPNGRRCCHACTAIACGYRGLDDAIDLGIVTAIELQERA